MAESGAQYLQISTVFPVHESVFESGKPHAFDPRLPPRALSYLANNRVRAFFYQRPFRMRKEKSANEFLDCWVAKTYVLVDGAFPCTQRRLQIVRSNALTLNPLETAVGTLQDKNRELREKIGEMALRTARTTDQSFTMMMNGVVDAAVNGGIKNYETFLTGEYRTATADIAADMASHPEKAALEAALRSLLEEQLRILVRGMAVHGRVCSETMRPLHDYLCGRFVELLALMRKMGATVPEYTPELVGTAPPPPGKR